MVVWTGDFDGAGESTQMMKEIMDPCNNKWAVKEVSNDYMVGVTRIFETDDAGVEHTARCTCTWPPSAPPNDQP